MRSSLAPSQVLGVCASLAFGLGLGGSVCAETLADAVALAYQSNPALQSQRAQVRVLDEGYVQAVAGLRPQLGLQITAGYTDRKQLNFSGVAADAYSNTGQAQLAISQPVYTGGRVSTAVKAASFDLLAGREQLLAVEANVLQQVVQGYADVLRDQETLKVREAELEVLQSQYDDARARRGAGEVTETDVLQSLAQLQIARAALSTAQGQLQVSRAEYTAVVGQNPGVLAALAPIPGLPKDVDEAFDAAIQHNPTLNQARQTEEASRWRIANARAATRPAVQVQGTYSYSGLLSPYNTRSYLPDLTVQAILTQPIFTGGVNTSNIRRAVALNDNDRIQIEAQRRLVVEQVAQTWNQILSLKQSLLSDEQEVVTSRQYFADTEEEYRVGARSTLDVLVAEQTLRGAEVAVIQARHDAYLSQTSLLAAMGRLELSSLVEGAPQYDPSTNLRQVVRAQSVPWERVVAALDSVGAPGLGLRSALRAPSIADPPAPLRPAVVGVSVDASPAVVVPTRPFPGTVSRRTPAVYGHDADEVARAASSTSETADRPLNPAVARVHTPITASPTPAPPARAAAAAQVSIPPVVAAATPRLAPTPTPTVAADAGERVYAVASGDTLFGLGRRFHLAPSALALANGMHIGGPLAVGARVRLPRGVVDAGEQAHATGAVLSASKIPTVAGVEAGSSANRPA